MPENPCALDKMEVVYNSMEDMEAIIDPNQRLKEMETHAPHKILKRPPERLDFNKHEKFVVNTQYLTAVC